MFGVEVGQEMKMKEDIDERRFIIRMLDANQLKPNPNNNNNKRHHHHHKNQIHYTT